MPLVSGLVPRFSWRDTLAFVHGGRARAAQPLQAASFHSWFENMAGSPTPMPIPEVRPHEVLAEVPSVSHRPYRSPPNERDREARPIVDRGMVVVLAIWMAGVALLLVRLARAVGHIRALVAASTSAVP